MGRGECLALCGSVPLMRSDEYCAAISRFLAGFGARFARYRSTLLLKRRRAWASVKVCCVLWDEGQDSEPKLKISQHTGRGFCGFLRLVWLAGFVWLPVREGRNLIVRQCGKPRSTGERGGAWRGVAVRRQAKAGWLRLRLCGGQAGSNPGFGAAGDVVDRKALGL